MSAEALLDRLDGVKQTSTDRWIAKCPAHADRSPSLSIRELEDGRVLIHDFGMCDPRSVVEAVGLSLADLFPATYQQDPHYTPSAANRKIPAADRLEMLALESEIVLIVACDLRNNLAIAEADFARLTVAVQRIAAVRAYQHGR